MMNVKPTDEIVGDLPRNKTHIIEGIYRKPAVDLHEQRARNARAKLHYEMLSQVPFPPIQNQRERQRELVDLTAWVDAHTQALCGIPAIREQIEAAQRQAMFSGIGWLTLSAEKLEAISSVDIWAVPSEPENAATLREHAHQLTGCTENDPVMDSDRPGIAAMDNSGPAGDPLPANQRDELRDAWRKGSVWGQPPEPPPAPEPPPHNLGVIAPISGRVGGKWGAQ